MACCTQLKKSWRRATPQERCATADSVEMSKTYELVRTERYCWSPSFFSFANLPATISQDTGGRISTHTRNALGSSVTTTGLTSCPKDSTSVGTAPEMESGIPLRVHLHWKTKQKLQRVSEPGCDRFPEVQPGTEVPLSLLSQQSGFPFTLRCCDELQTYCTRTNIHRLGHTRLSYMNAFASHS